MSTVIDHFNNIVLNETVYIYKKDPSRFYSKNYINNLFRAVKAEKEDDGGQRLYSFVNYDAVSSTGRQHRISGIVIKYSAAASFVKEFVHGWEEVKLGYLFLIDFSDYLFILKRNISGLSQFTDLLEPLPYELIAKMLYNHNSMLESYAMDNMDSSSSAMKSRRVAAENLQDSFNYAGANTYVLNFIRILNDRDRFAIAVNTSRLTKSGGKSQLLRLGESCAVLVRAAENFVNQETPLDVFADPCDYVTEKPHLIPSSVTIFFTRLLEDIDNGIVTDLRYEYNFRQKHIPVAGLIDRLTQYIELEDSGKPDIWDAVLGTPGVYKDVTIKLNPRSIRLYSQRLSRVKVYGQDGLISSVIDYLNNRSNFFVSFEESEYQYTNRSLFKDSKLLGAISQFLEYFIPDAAANQIISEKGTFNTSSVAFDNDSAFFLSEAKYQNSEYLVLDDLGGEWADHIAIDGKNIVFIHSKANSSIFSATAFTEIIGQAQKNMGALNASETMIRNKAIFWQGAYQNNHVITQIPRLRRGSSVNGFIERYISLTKDVNSHKTICLNINFISKALLTTNLHNLRNGINFGQKKEAIQILWQISSLIGSCHEYNVGLQIWCKP